MLHEKCNVAQRSVYRSSAKSCDIAAKPVSAPAHHHLPHIHAKYAEFEASIGLGDGEILAGDLPRKQLRLVQAWIELHRDERMADWELAASGESPYRIEPL